MEGLALKRPSREGVSVGMEYVEGGGRGEGGCGLGSSE